MPSCSTAACSSESKTVYESLPESDLEPDQMRLVTRMYEHFVRRGAKLNAAEKAAAVGDQSGARVAVRGVPRESAADENACEGLSRAAAGDGSSTRDRASIRS